MRSALIAALVVVSAACARPVSQQALPTPSPSPTPTIPLAMTASAPFHSGEVGIAYAAVALSATGGVQPYTWSISDGALPDGLTLGPDGTVSGTPSAAGNFTFTVHVADAGDSTATLPGSVPIAAALAAGLIPACATQCSVELGCVSVCGAFGQQGGGVGPYSYALTSGQLPSGTSLAGLSLTGTFTGLSGYLKFSVQVTDSFGATASVAPTFWMYQHISLASGGTCLGGFNPQGNGCATRLQVFGGVPQGAPSVAITNWAPNNVNQGCGSFGPPPAGYGLSVSGGFVNVTIPGNLGGGYGAIWTLVLTDHAVCGPGTYCTSPAVTLSIQVQCS